MPKRVLVCHDGSALATEGLMGYLRAQGKALELTIFHVMEPFPPMLLEHEGSEDPHKEELLEAHMEERRRQWALAQLEKANREFQPLLETVKKAGGQGVGPNLKIVPSYLPEDLVPLLKLEAGSGAYDEVFIVTHAESWLKSLLNRTTADRVRRELPDLTVRIVSCSEKTGQCEL